MANNFDSNFTRRVAKVFLDKVETDRVHSKNVDTQLLKMNGGFKPDSGDTIDFKRPTDYKTKRTSTGDITGIGRENIITGKASGIVQDYFTVDVDYDETDEALRMDQLDQLLAPMATRIVTDFELDFTEFMFKNTALLSGTVGTAITTWDDVANAGAVLTSHGIPTDMPWFFTINPFTQTALASNQRSLGAGGTAGGLINTAHRKATIVEGFAGFDKVMTATTLASYTTDVAADRAGTLSANPIVTYVAAKDTMTQALAVAAFGPNLVVKTGDTIQITGRNRLNLSTRKVIVDAAGANILWTATVIADVVLSGTGTGTIVVTGPAIFETDPGNGAFNTVDSAPISGDVITLLGAASTTIQPNLFWHKQAFSVGSVPIKKLHSTDTLATTEDGLQFRVSKYANEDANRQVVRFDFHPAFGVMNPFFAGKGFGI